MAKKKKPDPGKCYIDACVFLSYIDGAPKDRIEATECLFDECYAEMRVAYTSHLSIAEVAFANWERTQRSLDPETQKKIDALWHPESPFLMAEVSEFVVFEARELMRTAIQHGWGLKAHDAIHFASARRLQVTEFFTYDDKLYKWDGAIGFKVIPPYVTQQKLFPPPPGGSIDD